MSYKYKSIPILFSTITAVLLLNSSIAAANWTFDPDVCSPLTQHEIKQVVPPAAMIMVDRSGSMDWDSSGYGSPSRWIVAKQAVNTITSEMMNSDPNQLEFGFGMYQGNTAKIYHEVQPNANPHIMATMNSLWPTGGTPTAEAITAMYKSATVKGTVVAGPYYQDLGYFKKKAQLTIPDSYGVGEEKYNCGFLWLSTCYRYSAIIDGSEVQSSIAVTKSKKFDRLTIDLTVENDNGLYDYEIFLDHNGKKVKILDAKTASTSLSSWNGRRIIDFDGRNMSGTWKLIIQDKYVPHDRDKIVPKPGKLVEWALHFEEQLPMESGKRATAGILITDGFPNNAKTAIEEACLHRKVAPLYVVGLGSSTDTAYNNVMAAAGGTGSCTNGDVCTNTANYNQFYGKCEGSYQANNAAALGTALASITSAISCTYPLTVLGGGTVPKSNLGCEGYDCVHVALNGGIGRIYHETSNHNDATAANKGWTWASEADRKFVKLNPYYCGKVQSRTASIVETQVACLCTENFDTECTVKRLNTCECPTGRWTCNYGTDTCNPSASCNGPREGEGGSCSNGKLGICEETGQNVCDSAGNLGCNAGPGPAPRTELCNGLDDNCDGTIDNVDWEGTAACHVDFGRNNAKIKEETIRCNVGHASCVDAKEICVPLLPMPEVCNGLDDDCDGRVDNLAGSLTRYNEDLRFTPNGTIALAPARPAFTGDWKTAACFERDICNCPAGSVDISSKDYMSDDYEDYLDSYWRVDDNNNPVCLCSSGLND